MIVILIKYNAAIEEIDKYLSAHRQFLDEQYKQGLLLASGPKTPRTGGVIIATSNDVEQVEAVFANDPFVLADLAEYEFIQFSSVKYASVLKEIVQKTEGNLC